MHSNGLKKPLVKSEDSKSTLIKPQQERVKQIGIIMSESRFFSLVLSKVNKGRGAGKTKMKSRDKQTGREKKVLCVVYRKGDLALSTATQAQKRVCVPSTKV